MYQTRKGILNEKLIQYNKLILLEKKQMLIESDVQLLRAPLLKSVSNNDKKDDAALIQNA